jgi:UDP-glucose 4-epimerase
MHFAALIEVGVSVREPDTFWKNNVTGTMSLLDAMVATGLRKIVFSSTCAVNGDQDGVMLDETSGFAPASPYAASKFAVEHMLHDYGTAFGIRHLAFRYFNVAGADDQAKIGEHHRPETHLIPLILDAIEGKRDALSVFGQDYPTRDGTCVRDYVHVEDLADAHIKGLQYLERDERVPVLTLGTGDGFTVREVMEAAAAVTGKPVPASDAPRRAGDPASLVCGSKLAGQELGWTPDRSNLKRMIADAYRWHQSGHYEK